MNFSDKNDAEIEKSMECAQPNVDNSKGTTSPPINDSSSLVDSRPQKIQLQILMDSIGLRILIASMICLHTYHLHY